MKERTFIILKPDSVQRGLTGEVISRFEKAGLKIVGIKMLQPDRDHYYRHYEDISKMITRRGEEAFERTLSMMLEGPVIALVLEGSGAIMQVRKMVGSTAPEEAVPGTIRGDYAHIGFKAADEMGLGVPNIIHASGNEEEAKQEIAHWFEDAELYSYKTVHERHTMGE